MLQWNDGVSWEHRAYWGENLLGYGVDGTSARRHMGPLPPAGQWVRLEVPAGLVGLEGRNLSGMAFALFDGRATWDAAGKASGGANPTEVFTVATLAPGASASFTGSYTLPAAGACSVTTTLLAAAADNCTGVNVSATVTSTCPLVTAPAIEVTQTCPVNPGVQGGLLTYAGTVKNIGNITLTNVVVVNSRSGPTPVLVLATLAPGVSANFTGSYMVPVNCCTVSSTATATGADICTGRVVADTATSTCLVLTSPQITVTKVCPLLPVAPGDLLEYSGTVRNTGNITLVDVFVVNSQPGAGSPVLGPLTLAPGESADYTASYLVPADFCGTDTVTARGTSICETPVTASVTTTCPIVTTPDIEVTKNCPLVPPRLGAPYTFTGTVRNTGNVTLTDVFVVNSQPAPNTPVIGPITLAPGASADFSATLTAPMDCCEITETVIATGRDLCTGASVSDRASTACPILTVPRLALVQNCPPNLLTMGSQYQFSGYVTNTGDVNLTNVFVFGPQGTNTVLLGPIELAPGESELYFGSATVPFNVCSVPPVTATGREVCGGTAIATNSVACPVATLPRLAITQDCPVAPVSPGGLLTFRGTISNTGDITLTNVVVRNNLSGVTPVVTAALLAPGATVNFTGSYLAPTNCATTSSSTVTGLSHCGTAVTNTVSVTCPIVTTPQISVTAVCPPTPALPGGLIVYTGTVWNTGNITLTNVVVVGDRPAPNTPVLTIATLAPGAATNFTASVAVPANACAVTTTFSATGRDICTLTTVTRSATTTCAVITTQGLVVTLACPPVPGVPGGLVTFTGTVRNTGNVTLTNVSVMNGQSADSTPVTARITRTGDVVLVSWTATPGLTYQVQYKSDLADSTWTNLGGTVTASSNVASQEDPIGANFQRFYRVRLVSDSPVSGPLTLAPGAVSNFSFSVTAPDDACSVSGSVTVTGTGGCSGDLVTDTASVTCPLATTPALLVTQDCLPPLVGPGGLMTYTGTVTNAGNITLTNVVVRNSLSGTTPIFTAVTLRPGDGFRFSGSYVAPTNCASFSLTTVIGQSLCGLAVTNTADATCLITTSPGLVVTQTCPPAPVSPGGLLTFTGTVRNSGNITLNNVVVTNSRTGNLPLLTLATLAPGATANFTGSYTAPASGPSTSTSTARADSLCGDAVANTVTTSCPILTAPGLAVTKLCPPVPVAPGGLLTFTGTVTNTGDVTLTNVFVVNNQPAANTPVLGPITLLPGAGTNFTRSYVVPLNVCEVTDTLTATGNSAATGLVLTDTATATCTLATTPDISITETCPVGPVAAGSSVVFGGLVSNTGDITLTNVLVFSSSPTNNTPVLGPITLAPGESAPFTGSFIALGGSNPTTNSTIVTNSSGTITTNVASVITTNRTDVITTNTVTPTFGTINPVSGTITDRFEVVDGLHGLMFADQDVNWGPTRFYSTRHPNSGADQFETISTIPPSVGVVTDRFSLSETGYDALTLAAPDVGYGAVNFYYVRHDASGDSTFGVIKAAGASSSSDLWAIPGSGYTGLAFAAADVGYGANMFYYVRQDVTGLSTFGTINPTPGGIAMDRYAVKPNTDALVFVPSAVSTWGTGIFAYLRHDDNGSVIGTIDPVTQLASDRIDLGTNFLTALTFTATDVGYGPNLFYYLRPAGSFQTTNVVTTFTTNTVITLITNTVTTFTTNSVVLFTPTNTVTAIGVDICQARTVTAAANCLGPVALFSEPGPLTQSLVPAVAVRATANGHLSLSFSTERGKSLTVQYKNSLSDPDWTDLETVVGTGGILPIMDADAAEHSARFYRVIVTPQ